MLSLLDRLNVRELSVLKAVCKHVVEVLLQQCWEADITDASTLGISRMISDFVDMVMNGEATIHSVVLVAIQKWSTESHHYNDWNVMGLRNEMGPVALKHVVETGWLNAKRKKPIKFSDQLEV